MKIVVAALLGKCAQALDDDADAFVMSITAALPPAPKPSADDPIIEAGMTAYTDIVEQIEHIALPHLD